MINLDTLDFWLTIPKETENLEFKEAKQQYDRTKLLEYCAAIAVSVPSTTSFKQI